MKKHLLVLGILLVLASCAQSVDAEALQQSSRAGFWWGLWNGATLPFSFIGSLFSETILIYQPHNNGGWYDFGFVLGCGSLAGGAASR